MVHKDELKQTERGFFIVAPRGDNESNYQQRGFNIVTLRGVMSRAIFITLHLEVIMNRTTHKQLIKLEEKISIILLLSSSVY